MNTVGFGLKCSSSDISILQDELSRLSKDFKYQLYYDWKGLGLETEEGIVEMVKAFNLELITLIFKPSNETPYTSDLIVENLRDAYFENKTPEFRGFLEKALPLIKLYASEVFLFFAYEWTAGTRIRYKVGTVADLFQLLRNPHVWSLYLYDMNANVEYPDLDTPLIFKIALS